jgi:hypothetical protein
MSGRSNSTTRRGCKLAFMDEFSFGLDGPIAARSAGSWCSLEQASVATRSVAQSAPRPRPNESLARELTVEALGELGDMAALWYLLDGRGPSARSNK